MKIRAYLDIETTGLSSLYAELTVVGVGIEKAGRIQVVQFFEDILSADSLLGALAGADEIYTYNGSRFDLPFIRGKFAVDVPRLLKHTDLMYACWRNSLKGGLKAVERLLAIDRKLHGVDGRAAVRLWDEYVNNYDRQALATLLEYNREDVVNLRLLREKLGVQ